MKKIIKKVDNLLYKCGWFAIAALTAAIVTLMLLISNIVTPFLNSIIWGITV